MKLSFSEGDIIANQYEIVVRLPRSSTVRLQAEVDMVSLIGGVNMINVVASGAKWSIKLDNDEQLMTLSAVLGVDIQRY